MVWAGTDLAAPRFFAEVPDSRRYLIRMFLGLLIIRDLIIGTVRVRLIVSTTGPDNIGQKIAHALGGIFDHTEWWRPTLYLHGHQLPERREMQLAAFADKRERMG